MLAGQASVESKLAAGGNVFEELDDLGGHGAGWRDKARELGWIV
jgi:hypothetical protein